MFFFHFGQFLVTFVQLGAFVRRAHELIGSQFPLDLLKFLLDFMNIVFDGLTFLLVLTAQDAQAVAFFRFEPFLFSFIIPGDRISRVIVFGGGLR